MAHHGDVARPPPAAAAPAPTPAPSLLAGLASTAQTRLPRVVTGAAPAGDVSLDSPRPDVERTTNEYVETPFRPPAAASAAAAATGASGAKSGGPAPAKSKPGGAVRTSGAPHPALHLPVVPHRHNNNKTDARTPPPSVRFSTGKRSVVKQPGATATFKKDVAAAGAASAAAPSTSGASTSAADCFRDSIICPECGRCRCESCRKPRALPARWLCNDACLCSAESVLDYASCLCCVKGLFYHCSVDYEGDDASCTDDPCSCGPPRLVARWGCMGLLSLVLPCLWCYWPLRACVGVGEKCYARYSAQGCRCEPRLPRLSDAVTPEKRLLDASPDY